MLLAAAALSAVVQGAVAASPVFSATGKSFVLSTPEWTLMSPLSDTKGLETGVFINGTFIHTFPAPKNKASVAFVSCAGCYFASHRQLLGPRVGS